MMSPFFWLSRAGEYIVFGLSLVVTIILLYWLNCQGQRLHTADAPNGNLSLQLAWSKSNADEVLASWGGPLHAIAVRQILLDYLFLIAYPVFLSLSCVLISRHVSSSLAELGVVIAWVVLCAGVLDAIENGLMLWMLNRGSDGCVSYAATICAGLKWAFVFSALGYLAVATLDELVSVIRK